MLNLVTWNGLWWPELTEGEVEANHERWLLSTIHQLLHLFHKCILICMAVSGNATFFNHMEPRIPLSSMGRDCTGEEESSPHRANLDSLSKHYILLRAFGWKFLLLPCQFQGVAILSLTHVCFFIIGCELSHSKRLLKVKAEQKREKAVSFRFLTYKMEITDL